MEDDDSVAKIIVADDHPLMRNVLGVCLRDAGYDVIEVADGTVLLEELRNALFDDDNPRRADLVITDVHMPKCSGLRALELIRSVDAGLPVILMSAFTTPELHAEATRLGVTRVFDKPFDVKVLVAEVQRLLH
ncbi:MAG: two-component system response regulator [Archangium gephyra]|uniref:Two-component system response regulator n=1 Tax=Archangium gephyra TaxID=48 RepID=A0A2W5T607_9BACT|nr:MAG: two-component system response regulator [Archangium gephyra]